MIVDIDKKNNNLILMNILQLKWILHILTLKKNYKVIFKIISNLIINIFIKVYIHVNLENMINQKIKNKE